VRPVDPIAVNEAGPPRYGVATDTQHKDTQHKERRPHHGKPTSDDRPRRRLQHPVQRQRHQPHQATRQRQAARRRRPLGRWQQHVGTHAPSPTERRSAADSIWCDPARRRLLRARPGQPDATQNLFSHAPGGRGQDAPSHRGAADPYRHRHPRRSAAAPHRAGRGTPAARHHRQAVRPNQPAWPARPQPPQPHLSASEPGPARAGRDAGHRLFKPNERRLDRSLTHPRPRRGRRDRRVRPSGASS